MKKTLIKEKVEKEESPKSVKSVPNIIKKKDQNKFGALEKLNKEFDQENDKKEKAVSVIQTRKKSFNKSSNKKLIKNAITKICLAAEVHKKERTIVLEKLEESNADNYIIIFKSTLIRQVI